MSNLDPATLQKLAMLLKGAQQSTPTANTPFSNAGAAGNQVLDAYLAKQLMMQHQTPQGVNVTPQVQPNQAMSQGGYNWQQLKNMFNFFGSGS